MGGRLPVSYLRFRRSPRQLPPTIAWPLDHFAIVPNRLRSRLCHVLSPASIGGALICISFGRDRQVLPAPQLTAICSSSCAVRFLLECRRRSRPSMCGSFTCLLLAVCGQLNSHLTHLQYIRFIIPQRASITGTRPIHGIIEKSNFANLPLIGHPPR